MFIVSTSKFELSTDSSLVNEDSCAPSHSLQEWFQDLPRQHILPPQLIIETWSIIRKLKRKKDWVPPCFLHLQAIPTRHGPCRTLQVFVCQEQDGTDVHTWVDTGHHWRSVCKKGKKQFCQETKRKRRIIGPYVHMMDTHTHTHTHI